MIVAISFSVMGSPDSFSQRRKEKTQGAKKTLKPEWLQRPRLRAFEEPARADAQTMMPGRQPRSVHRETRLAGERTADYFAGREHCRVLSPEANGLSQFDETF